MIELLLGFHIVWQHAHTVMGARTPSTGVRFMGFVINALQLFSSSSIAAIRIHNQATAPRSFLKERGAVSLHIQPERYTKRLISFAELDHPHSEKPQTWHFTHPSANSNCDPQSGQVPINASPALAADSNIPTCSIPPTEFRIITGTPC